MALPADLSTFTLRGKYKDFEGNALFGNEEFVEITYPVVVNDPSETTTLVPRTIVRPLDATGSFSAVIPVSNDPDVTPTGFPITLKEKFAGGRTLSFIAPDGASTIWVSGMETLPAVDDTNVVYATFAELQAVIGDIDAGDAALDTRLDAAESTISALPTTYVALTGAQTVAGVKTFSSVPVLPGSSPTTANQAARKQYVDDGDAAVAASAVLLTGAQTVAGVKTFSSEPVVPTPTGVGSPTRKDYVDTAIGTTVKLTGAQTVAGVKTFSAEPVVPTPTIASSPTRKDYVDTLDGGNVKTTGAQTIAGIKTYSAEQVVQVSTLATSPTRKDYVDNLDGANVKLTGAQAVGGVKTFSSSPIVPTPTTAFQAATKGYVDGLASGSNPLLLPSALGYTAWVDNPRYFSTDQLALNNNIYISAFYLPVAQTITKLVWHIGAAGATPTAGQNWVGLYSTAGTRLAQAGVDADISSTGHKESAISYAAAVGTYYMAFLFNAATAPQMPRLAAGSARASLINGALTGANTLFGTNGTGTTLPTTLTMASSVPGIGFFGAVI